LLHRRLIFGIKVSGSLVKNNYAWILKKQARDCDALLFASRKTVTAIAHNRIEPIGERLD
jgi:hypothetical protein